ncbi:MAG TPA: GIY-YIG nuclease family protein [Kouleothrix sp.]|nr:GIY-YIG nuclease family protein [Kouleothrix sp.]
MKGVYLLILSLRTELADLTIGRLGRFRFAPGYYLYVGSARGPGGIAARLAHHERSSQARPHWHIDYLRVHAALTETWGIATNDAELERCWARELAGTPGLNIPAPGFGASDSNAPSHLFYAQAMPMRQALLETLLHCAEGLGAHEFTLDIRDYRAR